MKPTTLDPSDVLVSVLYGERGKEYELNHDAPVFRYEELTKEGIYHNDNNDIIVIIGSDKQPYILDWQEDKVVHDLIEEEKQSIDDVIKYMKVMEL